MKIYIYKYIYDVYMDNPWKNTVHENLNHHFRVLIDPPPLWNLWAKWLPSLIPKPTPSNALMNPNSAEKSPELKENQPGDSKIHTFFLVLELT